MWSHWMLFTYTNKDIMCIRTRFIFECNAYIVNLESFAYEYEHYSYIINVYFNKQKLTRSPLYKHGHYKRSYKVHIRMSEHAKPSQDSFVPYFLYI